MRRYLLALLISVGVTPAFAQPESVDGSMPLDLITAPNSPGFTILGISPEEIERPQTPTDFAVNILSSTQNFTSLPQNYSLEFAPAWLFTGKKIRYAAFSSDSIRQNLWQTLTVSLATADGFTPDDTRFGAGLHVSILRGTIDEEFGNYRQRISRGFAALDSFNRHFSDMINDRSKEDPVILENEKQFAEARRSGNSELAAACLLIIDARKKELAKQIEQELVSDIESLKQAAAEIPVRRIGWKWDLAAATALDFAGNDFTNSYVTHTGLWTTAGYEAKSNLCFLATGRVFFQHANAVTLDSALTNLDGGIRLIYDNGKFSFSGEALYRQSIMSDGGNAGQWKYDVNAAYNFMPNKTLTFSLGKNFDQLSTEFNGNLIAWLNVLIGLGAKRNLL
jgi:hypothetical protein